MLDAPLQSGWGSFLVAIPCIGMLFFGLFRLDTLFAAPKHQSRRRRPASGTDENGHTLFSDPDGRPW